MMFGYDDEGYSPPMFSPGRVGHPSVLTSFIHAYSDGGWRT